MYSKGKRKKSKNRIKLKNYRNNEEKKGIFVGFGLLPNQVHFEPILNQVFLLVTHSYCHPETLKKTFSNTY